MCNVNLIEDNTGQLIDIEYFCSDLCARESENYNGDYPCVELDHIEKCQTCNVYLGYWDYSTNSYVDPKTLLILEQCRKLDNPYHLAPPITNK